MICDHINNQIVYYQGEYLFGVEGDWENARYAN